MRKVKYFFMGIGYLLISPIYIPVIICWEEREEVIGCYKQIWQAITFQDVK
jgi:hypothetical protein